MPAPFAGHPTLETALAAFGACCAAVISGATAWKHLRVRERARGAAGAVVRAGLAHDPAHVRAVVAGHVADDLAAGEDSRVKRAVDKAYAPVITARDSGIAAAHAAVDRVEQAVGELRTEIRHDLAQAQQAHTASTDRLAVQMAALNGTLERVNDTLTTHGDRIGAGAVATATAVTRLETLERLWYDGAGRARRERRQRPDPGTPRTRGGKRRTDPPK